LNFCESERSKLSAWSYDKALRTLLMPLRALVTGATAPSARNSTDPHAAYRKCPQCGERDLRLSDRQRAKPDVYQSRLFQLKWLCLACGYRENETIEETE